MYLRRVRLVLFALLAFLTACGAPGSESVSVVAPSTTIPTVKTETPMLLATRDGQAVARMNRAIGANMIEAAAYFAAQEVERAARPASRTAPTARSTGQRQPASSFASRDAMWEALAICETGGDWQDGGDYGGGLGIYVGTWLGMGGGGEFAPRAQYATRAEQIIVAERIAQHGFGGWGCAERVGLK